MLDPSNLEIPTIISRIFPNQNLSDVMKSSQMKEANQFLKEKNVKTVFE
jgi:hypothetical protein